MVVKPTGCLSLSAKYRHFLEVAQYYIERDPVRKKRIKEKLDNDKLPFYLGTFEEWAEKNNGYLANGKVRTFHDKKLPNLKFPILAILGRSLFRFDYLLSKSFY